MTVADPVLEQIAQIVSVYEIQQGSALSADITAGATFLTVDALDDFADAGGSLFLRALDDADNSTEPLEYVGLDRDNSRILLAAAWDPNFYLYTAGDSVWIAPIATERRADVALDGEEDQIVVSRIPYALAASIPLGVRAEHAGEWVTVQVTDYGYRIADAILEYAKTDPDSIIITDPDTGEEIGSIGGDAAFDTVTADEIISPSVPKRNYQAALLYVDPILGLDDNDGTAFAPLADTFSRVVANGLGTSDSAHVWTTQQNQGNLLEVNGTDARLRMNGANQNVIVRNAFGALDYEILAQINLSNIPTAGSADYGVALRIVDGTTYLLAGLNVGSSGAVAATLTEKNGGSYSSLGQSASFGTFTGAALAAVDWMIRAQIQTNPDGGSDLRVKVWKTTDPEPDGWTVEANESIGAFQTPLSAGVAIRSGGSMTGAPICSYRALDAYCIDANGIPIDVSAGGVGPLATIAQALSVIGQWNDADVRIILSGTFDESIFVLGLAGGGRVFIDGTNNATTSIYGVTKLYGIHQYFELRNITFQDTGDAGVSGTIEVRTSRHVEIQSVKIQGNGARTYNVFATEGSDVRVQNSTLVGATAYCVQVTEESTAFLQDNSGSAGTGSYRSAYAIIFQDGTKPTGATSTTFGGQIFGTTTTSGGGTPPPTSNKVTKTYAPNATRTWRPAWDWRDDNDEVYQGEYAGSGGISRGCAFHGTKLNVAGKTADSGKIFVKRLNSGGSSGPEAIYLFSHDLASQPSGTAAPAIKDSGYKLGTLSWGEGKWFDIPKSWVQSMLDGTGGRRGFGLYHASASPYVIAAGKGNGGDVWKVKFTFH